MRVTDLFTFERIRNGMSAAGYLEYLEKEAARASELREIDEKARYLVLNLHRSRRIDRTYHVSEKLKRSAKSLSKQQLWMILTEPWCGDSAQCVPYIVKIAACSELIEVRFLLRDQNLDIMARYLTDGTLGIPKLVSIDLDGNELFRWGPRPLEAMMLFRSEREAGTPKELVTERLHRWYAEDRGRAIESEFLDLFTQRLP